MATGPSAPQSVLSTDAGAANGHSSSRTDVLIRQLRATLGKLEIALGAVADSLVWTDLTGRVQWCNASFDRLIGRPHLQLLGAPLGSVLPLAQGGRAIPADAHPASIACGARHEGSGIYEFQRGDTPCIVEVAWTRATLGEDVAVVFSIQDITERKRAEDKLRQLTAELERSNQELKQFAYVASHDLQEPLRLVASFCQLLERRYRDRLDQEAAEFIAFAVDGAQRMHSG
jgi:PAS domain-containing protein